MRMIFNKLIDCLLVNRDPYDCITNHKLRCVLLQTNFNTKNGYIEWIFTKIKFLQYSYQNNKLIFILLIDSQETRFKLLRRVP